MPEEITASKRMIHMYRSSTPLLALIAALWMLLSGTAQAQLNLPGLPNRQPLPNALPTVTDTLNHTLDNVITNASTELNTRAQPLLRVARVRKLLRAHPDVLEADPNGEPMVRAQVLAISPSDAALQRAQQAGFVIVDEHNLSTLNLRTVVLRIPSGMSTHRALKRLRRLDSTGTYDYNHVYMPSGSVTETALVAPTDTARIKQASNEETTVPRIGLIDSGIDTQHPALQHNVMHTWGCDGQSSPTAHGTAVASLLAGNSNDFSGAAPGAELLAVDVYCQAADGGSITRIADALARLVEQHAHVINMSLVGPDNLVLRQLVQHVIAAGNIIVAAVGNDGPAAPPLYPAAYEGVVGVTAVDAHNRVLIEAGHGKQVAFAAPGADMAAATLHDSYAQVRGTSFAAPLVAGLLAITANTHRDASPVDILKQHAVDLGSRGYDTTYGYGLVGATLRIALDKIKNAAAAR